MKYALLNLTEGDNIVASDMNHLETMSDNIEIDIATHTHDDVYLTQELADSGYWSIENGQDCDADTLEGSHAADLMGTATPLPVGTLAFWDGRLSAIPIHWQLANGSNGTLDMRNFFPVCTSATIAIGATLGDVSVVPSGSIDVPFHALTIAEMPAHRHYVADKYNATGSTFQAVYAGGSLLTYRIDQISSQTTTVGAAGRNAAHGHSATWSADAVANLPPYLALYIIEKVS